MGRESGPPRRRRVRWEPRAARRGPERGPILRAPAPRGRRADDPEGVEGGAVRGLRTRLARRGVPAYRSAGG